jgi:hypothetical protein
MQRPHVSDPWYIGTRVPPYDTATRSSSFPDYRASCANRACSANASWPAWPDSPVDGGTHQSDKTSPASTRCRLLGVTGVRARPDLFADKPAPTGLEPATADPLIAGD